MTVSVRQTLLLNNLMYMEPSEGPFPDPAAFSGMKVRDWLSAIDIHAVIDPDPDNLSMTTAREWTDIILAAKKDRVLMDMKILTVFTDLSEEGGGCRSAIFLTPKEAVIVFKGTDLIGGYAQWKDNFYSGNVPDSPHQLHALRWYREVYRKYRLDRYEVIVTGHSKGGNKAKYVTILDDTVSRCDSFDGEGFSDKFFAKYRPQISLREDYIHNHVVDYDYISLLMNDIGQTTFYYGYNIGVGGFTENHLANTFMRFDEYGDFHLDERKEGRPAEMLALDEFSNSYLRSLPDEEKTKALNMLNDLQNTVMSIKPDMPQNEIIDLFLQMSESEDNCRHIAYLLAYVIRFEQKYPVMADLLSSLFAKFGMESLVRYVALVANIINWKKQILWVTLDFTDISSAVNTIRRHVPDLVFRRLSAYLEKKGISLSARQTERLAVIVDLTDGYLKTITVNEDSTDRTAHIRIIRREDENL